MDRHPSTIKRHRQSLKRRDHNRAVKSRLRTLIKQVETADSQESAQNALKVATSALDKNAGPRAFHRNKTARLKSRLSKLVTSRFSAS